MKNALIISSISLMLAACSSNTNVYPIFSAEVTTKNTNVYDRAVAYQKGIGVPRNYDRAVTLFTEAAKKGDARAENNLGVMAMKGEGADVDYSAAMRYFKKAADKGSAAAHYNMGLMYDSGVGIAQNPERAVFHYRAAAEMGMSYAQMRLAVMVGHGYGVVADRDEASRLTEMSEKQFKLAAGGDRNAVLGLLATDHCAACKSDSEKNMAVRNYAGLSEMADAGDPSAQYNLGVRLLTGNNSNQDPSEAARLFTLSARSGYAPAQRQLAQMYLRGQAVGRSKVLAHAWLNLAAKSQGKEAAIAQAQMEELEVSMSSDEIRQAQDVARSGALKGR